MYGKPDTESYKAIDSIITLLLRLFLEPFLAIQ